MNIRFTTAYNGPIVVSVDGVVVASFDVPGFSNESVVSVLAKGRIVSNRFESALIPELWRAARVHVREYSVSRGVAKHALRAMLGELLRWERDFPFTAKKIGDQSWSRQSVRSWIAAH